MKYYITDVNGNRVPVEGGGFLDITENVVAAKTLTVEDSGKYFRLVSAGTAGHNITLPALTKGLSYKFSLAKLTATTAWTITCPTAVINGYVSVNYATIAADSESLVTFAHAADTIGDWVELKCNGTTWDIYGVGSLAGAITVTAP